MTDVGNIQIEGRIMDSDTEELFRKAEYYNLIQMDSESLDFYLTGTGRETEQADLGYDGKSDYMVLRNADAGAAAGITVYVHPAVTVETSNKKLEEGKKATRITSERVYVDEAHYKIIFSAATKEGEQLWNYVTEENVSSELDSAGLFGIEGDKVYIYDNGAVIALSAFTGEELWRNTEFTGGDAVYTFDAEENLYICGFYGPDIMKIDSSGKTVYRIQTLDDQYYWPYQLDYMERDNIVVITFDGNDSGSDENTLVVDAETGEIISNHKKNEGNLSGNGNETSGAEAGSFMYVVNCNESITLRSQPSTSASEICQIPLYGAVTYHGMAENGFYEVSYLDNRGYALSQYLDMHQPQIYTGATCTVVNCNESITLRTSPSTKAHEIMQIPLGASVDYIESAANGFYHVSYRGYNGYALASYLQMN